MKAKKPSQLNDIEKRYFELSEIYLAKYEKQAEMQVKIMIAKGVVVEMESDLVFFHIKNKKSEKSLKQEERIEILKSIIQDFSSIHASNMQFKYVMAETHRENQYLKEQNKRLNEEIDAHRKAMDGI